MSSKFKVGDKVRLTGKAPQYWLAGRRKRARTIVAISYRVELQATIYTLGEPGKGVDFYGYRSYQLTNANDYHTLGRPRLHKKRKQ